MHTTHKVDLDKLSYTAPAPALQAVYRRAVAVGGLFTLLSIVAFVMNFQAAIQAYLVAFILFVGLTVGPLGWTLTWFLPGGRWGVPMRRIWEAATRNIWVAAILFLPIAIFHKEIYPWANPSLIQEPLKMHGFAHTFLSGPFFIVRGFIYFVAFGFIIYLVNKYSAIQDKPYTFPLGGKLTALGAAGVLGYVWIVSFAGIDWILSLRPGWPSTIFPLIIVAGFGILGLAVGIITASILKPYEPMNALADDIVFHDNGKLLLAFVMLWAYFSYSQWLIIWSGNLPEEIHFFLPRVHGGWGGVALFLVLFQFAVPFAILLSQGLKKQPRKLAWVAAWLVFMRFVDLFWMTAPTWSPEHLDWGKLWMYPVMALASVGAWTALFVKQLQKRPLIVLYDPRLYENYGDHDE